MPLIITLRIIFSAAAAPTSSDAMAPCISSSSTSSGSTAFACGPASSSGVLWRVGWIGARIATST